MDNNDVSMKEEPGTEGFQDKRSSVKMTDDEETKNQNKMEIDVSLKESPGVNVKEGKFFRKNLHVALLVTF